MINSSALGDGSKGGTDDLVQSKMEEKLHGVVRHGTEHNVVNCKLVPNVFRWGSVSPAWTVTVKMPGRVFLELTGRVRVRGQIRTFCKMVQRNVNWGGQTSASWSIVCVLSISW